MRLLGLTMNVCKENSLLDAKLRELTVHESLLLSIIRSIVPDNETARDVLQDTYIKAIKALQNGSYSEQDYFKAWLCTIARNEAINVSRKQKRQLERGIVLLSCDNSAFPVDIADIHPGADMYVDYTSIYKDICTIIADRSDIIQSIFRLFFLSGQTMNDIADLLNVPSNTVRSLIFRMRHEIIPKGLAEMGYTENDIRPWL